VRILGTLSTATPVVIPLLGANASSISIADIWTISPTAINIILTNKSSEVHAERWRRYSLLNIFPLVFLALHCNRDILRCIPFYILKQVSVEAGNPLRYSCNRSVMNLYTSKRDRLILPEEIRWRRQ
jgi:hypothetical protein